MPRLTWLVAGLVLWLTGCQNQLVERMECGQFDGCITVQVRSTDPAATRVLLDTLFADLKVLDDIGHPLRSRGIQRYNALLQSGEWSSINPSVYTLTRQSQQFYEQSRGLYNPALHGALLHLWGLDREPRPKAPPPQHALDQLLAAHPRMPDIQLDGIRVRSDNPSVHMHFGWQTHGQAVDIALAYLESVQVRHARVEIGTCVGVLGENRAADWQVTYPALAPEGPVTLGLAGGTRACRLSPDDAPHFDAQGQRYFGIFDPRDGHPARASRAVVAIHPTSASAASAASQALFIAGPAQWVSIAGHMAVPHVLLVAANGDLHADPGMAARLQGLSPARLHLTRLPAKTD